MADLPHLEQDVRQSALGAMGPGIRLRERKTWTSLGLLWACWKGRTWIVVSSLLLDAVRTLLGYFQVICTSEIIKTFETPMTDKTYPELLCFGYFTGQTLYILITSFLWVRENYRLHLPTRMTLAAILFDKILHTADVQTTTTGGKGRAEIMNLLLNDNNKVASLATVFPNITNSIITIMVGSYLLWSMLGISAFIGLCVIPLSIPVSMFISRKTLAANRGLMGARDTRIKEIREFLTNSKVIKLNAFEGFYSAKIAGLRSIEVDWQRLVATLRIWLQVVGEQIPVLAILVTFFLYTKVFHHTLVPSTAFVALNLFNMVRSACSLLPGVVNELIATSVSLDRLTTFLNGPETEEPTWDINNPEIDISHATIGWPAAGEDAFKLEDLTLSLPVGKMTLIHGPIASGKTLLLRALLGEATVSCGTVRSPRSSPDEIPIDATGDGQSIRDHWTDGSVAYAPQQAYIRHGTIQDNIVYGQAWWPERYDQVLAQACLLPDLAILADGDQTEIGEKGVNLSGGQKTRINIARCLYSRARTVYMDDVLSAVDAHTARHIVDECFAGSLMTGRTLVLVSHHVNLCLRVADHVVTLEGGKVVASGSSTKVSDLPHLEDVPSAPGTPGEEKEQAKQQAIANQTPRKTVTEETRVKGMTSFRDFLFVLSAVGGIFYWVLLALVFMGDYGLYIVQVDWLRHWSSDPDPSHLDWNLSIYGILFTAGVCTTTAKLVWLYGIGSVGFNNGASRKIHKRMMDAIINAPLRWFESVPTGRLMNVLGRDVAIIDQASPELFSRLVQTVIAVISSAAIVCVQAPAMLIFTVIFLVPVYYLSKFLRKLRADIKRLSATASSPIVSLYHDAIDGVVMVRAFGSAKQMAAGMLSLINRERQTTLADYATVNGISASVQTACSLIVTVAAYFLVHRDLSAAEAGFYLTFALNTSQAMNNLLMVTSFMEMVFVSAERIGGHVATIPQEPIGGSEPDVQGGAISFTGVSARYAPDLPLVLENLSFDIAPGSRVGIVGATGSGKSTITLALLRAIELSSGRITLDGADVSTMDMHALRQALNMVTQDAILTSGTLRTALDIEGIRTDAELLETLARVHLSDMSDLDMAVAPGGGNFSHGQRQLLCLARSLLKRSKILIMDEATSNVDFEMDAKITATLKSAFQGVTMLVIAHRLATVINYDKIIVLDRGRLVEEGPPGELIERDGSAFRRLCIAQGEKEFDELQRARRDMR